MDAAIDLIYALMLKPGGKRPASGRKAPARRSMVSPNIRGNVLYARPRAGAGASKKGMARLSVESVRHAMSQRK